MTFKCNERQLCYIKHFTSKVFDVYDAYSYIAVFLFENKGNLIIFHVYVNETDQHHTYWRKAMKKFYAFFLIGVIVFLLYFINSVVGNPLLKALATSYAKQFLTTQFLDQQYSLDSVGFNFDSKMYDYIVTRQRDGVDYSYALTINSKLADRTVSKFLPHTATLDEALSTRLSSEGETHVKNIVHRVLPNANVEYKVYVPKGAINENTIWEPGFSVDLNAVIQINQTVSQWVEDDYSDIRQKLKHEFEENGIHYSRISIRVTEESLKDGITYMKTVFKDELYAFEG